MDNVTRGFFRSLRRSPSRDRPDARTAFRNASIVGVAIAFGMACMQPASAQAPDGGALARKLNCMSCHAPDRTLLGPSLGDIRKRYANQPGARDMLARKIQTGGSGAWGTMPMPANTQVNDDEAHALVDWILDPNR
jgi:cytochrome c